MSLFSQSRPIVVEFFPELQPNPPRLKGPACAIMPLRPLTQRQLPATHQGHDETELCQRRIPDLTCDQARFS